MELHQLTVRSIGKLLNISKLPKSHSSCRTLIATSGPALHLGADSGHHDKNDWQSIKRPTRCSSHMIQMHHKRNIETVPVNDRTLSAFITDHNTVRGNQEVRLATRADLFRLVAFLDGQLPHYCDVHGMVLAALQSGSSAYRIYFLRHPIEEEEYCAIVAIKEEKFKDPEQHYQKLWIAQSWAANETGLMKVYDAIDLVGDPQYPVVIFCDQGQFKLSLSSYLKEERDRVVELLPSSGLHMLDVQSALNLKIKNPDEVYVKSLERNHAKLVYDQWPYKGSTTVDDVANEIRHHLSAGVFLKRDDQLVSWAVHHTPTGMNRGHTLEQFRRKGYSSIVVRYLAKRMAQVGYVPFGYIATGNSTSTQMLRKLGFKFGRQVTCINLPSLAGYRMDAPRFVF